MGALAGQQGIHQGADLLSGGERAVVEGHDGGFEEARRLTFQFGVRVRLTTRGAGLWSESGGENSKFGLSLTELIDLMERRQEQDLPLVQRGDLHHAAVAHRDPPHVGLLQHKGLADRELQHPRRLQEHGEEEAVLQLVLRKLHLAAAVLVQRPAPGPAAPQSRG